ncbi:CRTAC1 family protein [Candidatus Gottesmanbacteria bacterium]|nr:CRTAC1 family protein [Candidatus Gottesmanbacteria bacterium]
MTKIKIFKSVFILTLLAFIAGFLYVLYFTNQVDRQTRAMLEKRGAQERDIARSSGIFTSFHFKNEIESSGITFRQIPVDDGAKHYKFIDYDHGNGLAAADIDGDGLLDFYFVSQLGGNKLYKNLGNGTFEDITKKAGVSMEHTINVSASFADFNNDGFSDLYVTNVRGGNTLFKNLGNGTFEDITKKAGVSYTGHSSASLFFDYNNDGYLDLLVLNVAGFTTDEIGNGGYYVGLPKWDMPRKNERVKLFKNLGNETFADVSESVGLSADLGWTNDAIFLDNAKTGYPNLFILDMIGKSHFFQNIEGKRFIDKTDEIFPTLPHGAMGVNIVSLNNSGRQDLYLTNMHDDMIIKSGLTDEDIKIEKQKTDVAGPNLKIAQRMPGTVRGNAFLKQKEDGSYEEISDTINAETYWPWGVSVGDINADGYDDLFVTAGMGYPFRYGINSLLLNDKGKSFLDSEFLVGIEPRKNMEYDIPWFVVHCSVEDSLNKECKDKKDNHTVRGALSSRSSVIADIDNDGDLDIVTNEWGSPPQILLSSLSNKKDIHFLKIKLIGTRSNRDGLGATVNVKAGGMLHSTYYMGKSGYLSQSQIPLYIGLGDATSIDSIEVFWPSKTMQQIKDTAQVNSTLVIAEQ